MTKRIPCFFILVLAFFIFEALFPLPYGNILVLAAFILFLFISSLSLASSVHGLRSRKTWIYAAVYSSLPFGMIYLFPRAFSPDHANAWDYFLIAFYILGSFWYLRMDKKDGSLIRRRSWIVYYLFGLMLLAMNVGVYFQENRSLLYLVLSIIVLTVLLSVFSIRHCRSKERNTQPTSVLP